MEDQTLEAKSEPAVRSRWSPKPEQILILESIFNSGMVNPPKEETVRIRKVLEKFGSVGDANVFYWFQNRRSRSRRRQRQMQAEATLMQTQHHADAAIASSSSTHHPIATMPHHHYTSIPTTMSTLNNNNSFQLSHGQMPFPEIEQTSSVTSLLYPPNMHFHSPGFMTVFINGVATEVPKGPIEMKPMFGEDVVLVHSSGVALPTNEFGILLHSLNPGESYFLVPERH